MKGIITKLRKFFRIYKRSKLPEDFERYKNSETILLTLSDYYLSANNTKANLPKAAETENEFER